MQRINIADKLAGMGAKMMGAFGDKPWRGGTRATSPKEKSEPLMDLQNLPNFARELPYSDFDPNTKVFWHSPTEEGQTVGFVLESTPLVGSNETMQKEITSLFTSILPEESAIQVTLFADPDSDDLFTKYVDARTRKTHKELAAKRVEFLRQFTTNSPQAPYTLRNFRCLISYTQTFTDKVKITEVVGVQRQLMTLLETVGIENKLWHANDLISIMQGVLSLPEAWQERSSLSQDGNDIDKQTRSELSRPQTFYDRPRAAQPWNGLEGLNAQVVPLGFGLTVKEGGLVLKKGRGEITARTFGVKRYPDVWSLFAMGNLLGDMQRDQAQIPCPFFMSYGIYVPKQGGLASKIMAKTGYIEKQAYSPIGKFLPDIVEQAEELAYARTEMGRGEKIVKTSFSITLFGLEDNLESHGQALKSLFTSQEWQLEEQQFMHLPIFLSQLPMLWQNPFLKGLEMAGKLRTTLSTESSNLLPLQGEWKGTATPSVLLTGRRGQFMTWSPFDAAGGNFNVAVVGRSGSGKSVFMQELMSSTLGLGGRVFVMDVGRSFEKTCVLMDGQFIEFDTKSKLCLNPFSKISEQDSEVAQDALVMLKSVFSLMASPSGGLDDMSLAILDKAILEVWHAKGQKATISDVADYLLVQEEKKANDMGTMLFPYTEKGQYGRFFNGPNNVDLTNPLVVVELEELKERKDLQAVIVQMMIITISSQMFLGDRRTPFHIVFDEAWDMLRHKQSGEFIETLARRLRKYQGSLIVGTQSINDFFENPGARAAYDNSDWMCLLSQKPESVDQLKKDSRLNMSEQLEEQIKSIKTRKGKYAEVMVKGQEGFSIGRLILDPFSNLLYSTQAQDYQKIKNLKDQGMGMKEAIEHYLEIKR